MLRPGHSSTLAILVRSIGVTCVVWLAPAVAQVIVSGTAPDGLVKIHNTDMAVFEAQEVRKDLPCSVSPNKPMLGFDLRFHSSYEIVVPLRSLAGEENLLSMLFRVRPVEAPEEAVYFYQRVRVPEIEEDAKGEAYLHGVFDIGEGDYKVDWLMRDRSERVCSSFWDVKAHLPERDRHIDLVMAPGEIAAAEYEQFREEPPVIRSRMAERLRVKVLVNFAPQNSRAATLQPFDTSALVSVLRTISREPRIGKFSIVAFNLQEQRVIYRQEDAERIDFPALGESLDSLNLGTIDLKRLSEKHGETRFLTELMFQELSLETALDALIITGPKALLSKAVSREELQDLGEVEYPIFYMNYNLYPLRTPWRDAIGHAVRFLDGYEYTITRPRDLWNAVTEMVSRIAKIKESRQLSQASVE